MAVVSGSKTYDIRRLREGEPEYADALRFIERVARERENAAPPPPPEFLFGAFSDGMVVATAGMALGGRGKPLPPEAIS